MMSRDLTQVPTPLSPHRHTFNEINILYLQKPQPYYEVICEGSIRVTHQFHIVSQKEASHIKKDPLFFLVFSYATRNNLNSWFRVLVSLKIH